MPVFLVRDVSVKITVNRLGRSGERDVCVYFVITRVCWFIGKKEKTENAEEKKI